MKTSDKGIELIKQYESLQLEAYPDPGTGAEPITIGYGHTGGVKLGDAIDEEQAEAYLRADLAKFERCVSRYITVDLTQEQFDALVCFTFNVGCGSLQNSTLVKLINEGDFDGAAEQFSRWNKAGGRVLAGLTKRREAEKELFVA